MRQRPNSPEIIESIEAKEVIDLSRRLIGIPSVYRKEHRAVKFILGKLERWGLDPSIVPVPGFGPDVVVETGPPSQPRIVLNGHIDTVEVMNGWKHDPFSASIEGGMLYGLGALDMKCGIAAMMVAFRHIAEANAMRRSRLMLQIVTGEEFSGIGTRVLIEKGYFKGARHVIVGEGFGGLGVITNGRKGGYYYDIELVGKAAHGALPKHGVNAVVDASRLVVALSRMRLARMMGLIGDDMRPLREVQTVLEVRGGGESLSVPDKCLVKMVRLNLPGMERDLSDEILAMARKLRIRSDVKVSLEKGNDLYHPYLTPRSSRLVRVASKALEEATGKRPRLVVGMSEADDNIIAHELRLPVICVGPGECGALARYHQPEEAISVGQLGEAARVYARIALAL